VNTFALVMSEHLNHHGFLFGGQLLKWVDEFAWVAAARDYPGYTLVTRAMDKVDFRMRVANGAILRFCIVPDGRTQHSVSYVVNVFADVPGAREEVLVFTNKVTFTAVDDSGAKVALPYQEYLRSADASCSD
jgi:acyl-CoA hydrolase